MSHSAKAVRIYEMFKSYLKSNNFRFDSHDDDLVITMTVHGEDLPQPTIIRVMDDRDMVQVLSPIPAKIPEDKRVDAAVAVATANYGMINGSFDLDMSDGEIRFRVAQTYKDMDFNEEAIRYLLAIVFFTTDKYNDRFFMLGKGVLSLEQFIEKEKE